MKLRSETRVDGAGEKISSYQAGLPRLVDVNVSKFFERLNLADSDGDEDQAAARLLNNELVQHDTIAYPLPPTTRPEASVSTYTPPDDDSLGQGPNEVFQELNKLLGFSLRLSGTS